ncbi:MAG: DNA gyrase inhibitor YacG [Bryobacteraceae bacterium]
MKCPICNADVSHSNPEMPFCSERCRTIDLGNWAMEKYVFSTPMESTIDGESVRAPQEVDEEAE